MGYTTGGLCAPVDGCRFAFVDPTGLLRRPTIQPREPRRRRRVGERVVDPRTLMLHRERMDKTSESQLNVPFLGAVPLREEETRETVWEFPD